MPGARIHITGVVQGVGMRPFVYREAVAHNLGGWVLNAGDGVHIEAIGAREAINSFVEDLSAHAPAASRIERVLVAWMDAADATCEGTEGRDAGEDQVGGPTASEPDGSAEGVAECGAATEGPGAETVQEPAPVFRIVASTDDTAHTTLVSPDIATCPDCLRELFDPADRRYHYPFINCTNCGPRFTIIDDLPYDRPKTSMAAFPMCPTCAAEYADPLDRRFHAQPDACFECGPHITWRERTEAVDSETEPDAAGGRPVTNAADTERVANREPGAKNQPSSPAGSENLPLSPNAPGSGRAASAVPSPSAVAAVGRTRAESDAIIERCVALLATGGIVAIKGLGGFHLACDAGNERAVRELRRRKRRSNKALAVMMRDADMAASICQVDAEERRLLEGSVRPIVLLQLRAAETCLQDAPRIAPAVTAGLPELGVMLPYTPLQHLLLAAASARGIDALVMTSGNISEEPIEIDDATAWEHLVAPGIADALLGNDRAILTRYDDSVVRVVGVQVMPVRRARGYAPQPLPLPPSDDAGTSVLACGPEQKATVALTRGTQCFVSQHIGDVENGATLAAWHEARRRLAELFAIEPTVLACDLHPSYLTSQWARAEAMTNGLPLVEVQHHHAHIASVIAEGVADGRLADGEQVIGLAFDGTGAGADGTVWGGEVLLADLTGFERVARLRPWRLPGGASSVRDARRNAFALLMGCGLADHPGASALASDLGEGVVGIIERMVDRKINSPLTSSMGRLLDALAALAGICGEATYEGEPAIRLEAAAWRWMNVMGRGSALDSGTSKRYRFDLAEVELPGDDPATADVRARVGEHVGERLIEIDPAPIVRSVLDDLAEGRSCDEIAWRIHQAVAGASVEVAQLVSAQTGVRTVALSGGVFMNRMLAMGVPTALEHAGLTVLMPHAIPVNDGCIAYGQAAVARARL